MSFFESTTKAIVTCAILFNAGPQVTTCAGPAKPPTPDLRIATCAAFQAYPFKTHDCDVAVTRFPYQGPNKVIPFVNTQVDSPWQTCNVSVSCMEPTDVSADRILTNGGQDGGYRALIRKCGTMDGSISLTGDCVLSTHSL